MEPLSLTRLQAAQALNVGISYLDMLISDGDIPSYKQGRLRRIRATDLHAYIDALAEADSADAEEQDDVGVEITAGERPLAGVTAPTDLLPLREPSAEDSG